MKNRGITLIALVVTIIVLLILAGITIALVFGQNGVIKKAQDSKEETATGEMREKLEMAKVPVYADGNGSYKVEDYWDRIESEGLIADKEVDKIDNGDGTYEVTTTPGYVFEITVEPNEEIADNIIIGECIGKGENLSIGLRVVNKTTNSIEIEVVRAEGASDFKYSIKKQGEEYGEAQESDSTTHTFSGLTQGAIYTIKVEATKDGEEQTVERTIQVGEIPRAIYGEVTWIGNGQAQVRIYTNETGYQLEWQKNGIAEGSWTRESAGTKEVTIPNLVNEDIIYARLYDGVSSGDWANIEVADDEEPNATIKLSATTIETNGTLTAEVTQTDTGSGVNIGQTKWVFNTEAGNIGTDASNYTGGTFTTTPETITLPTDITGTYYLHVLTIDNAGNEKEVISNSITIIKEVATDVSELVSGDYVIYMDGTNVSRTCMVLYDNSLPYGVQIVTMDTVEDVTLGSNDLTATGSTNIEKGINSYNNAISTLNISASKYNNIMYSDIARCIGTIPNDINSQSGYYRITNYISDYNGKLRDMDENYRMDLEKMSLLEITDIDKAYWLGSRYQKSSSTPLGHTFGMHMVDDSGIMKNGSYLCGVYYGDTANSLSATYGLRIVFQLKNEIKVTGGDGTKTSPYTLSI